MVDIGEFNPSDYDLGLKADRQDQMGTEEFDEFLEKLLKAIFEEEEIIRLFLEEVTVAAIKEELEGQRKLIDQGHYEAVILRQAAYLETFVTIALQERMESIKGSELTDNEEKALDRWSGNKQKVFLARMVGVFDEGEDGSPQEGEGESQVYNTIMEKLNDLAHNWWLLMPDNERKEYERQSKKFLEILEDSLEEYNDSQ